MLTFCVVLLFVIVLALSMGAAEGVRKGRNESKSATPLSINSELSVKLKKKHNAETRFCVQGQWRASPLQTLANYFVRTTVTVQSNFPMTSWYAVRGISSDDFYGLIKSTIFRYVFRMDEEDEMDIMKTRDSLEGYGFIRDLFSSCPSPLFHTPEQTRCSMAFSSVGEPCVTLDMEESIRQGPNKVKNPEVTIKVTQNFNRRGFILLLIGLTLLKMSGELSKSKTVQYIFGALSFIIMGFLIISLKVTSKFVTKREPREGDNRKMTLGLLLSGVYVSTGIYFLKTHLRKMLIVYWEMSLIYVIVMSLAGTGFVYFMRSHEETKHVYRVVGKHLTRAVGLFALYFSSASPLASTLAMIGSLISYVRYKTLKNPKKL